MGALECGGLVRVASARPSRCAGSDGADCRTPRRPGQGPHGPGLTPGRPSGYSPAPLNPEEPDMTSRPLFAALVLLAVAAAAYTQSQPPAPAGGPTLPPLVQPDLAPPAVVPQVPRASIPPQGVP